LLDSHQHGPEWTEATPEELRASVSAALDVAPDGWVVHLDVVHTTTRRETDAWLQSIQATDSMSGSSNGSERQNTPPFVEM
jgi:hypothetical protein